MWSPQVQGEQAPLYIDRRFVVFRDVPGFYSYAIFEHTKDMPAFHLNTTRIAFMLNKEKFHYMVITDDRQRFMPSAEDRLPGRGEPLAYPEAVLLVDPIEPEFKGEVDDKYQYSLENKDNQVHGWISFDPPVGFWQITPSNEFRTGGPFKQDLTSHVNPTTLAIFLTSHYAGTELLVKFETGEEWKKVLGPVFTYFNSISDKDMALSLWDDAKRQMNEEIESWPYSFPTSEEFPKCDQRGVVRGRLLVQDRYLSKENLPGKVASVGLAAPGDAGSWQRENKGYQFWTTTDEDGCFVIKNIRAGSYNLYGVVPGFIGDYKYEVVITLTEGCDIELGEIVYEPPRDGPTLWEIGIPDRSAAEFYIPDPNPKYVNKLYLNQDKFRQYGLWERYAELYPENDLVYTVGVSDYQKDWFFAQVNREIGDNVYQSSTWQIKFKIGNVDQGGTYTLRVALAASNHAELQVRINDPTTDLPLLSTGEIGGDNAIARHAIHGIYWLFTVTIRGSLLLGGENTIFLTQAKTANAFQGIMYDYIRLEGPSCQNENL
ncbi:probable rhamnogalacturonate lyase B isoform X2 [Solanum pennellii]|nr:probable rhamnogalacturonate lyase B isoform X2 [Solanum pennellii]XP_027769377.1 probable rhamnogalacturonate lyase B isoform X2 [Solanum pennellii]